MYCKNCGKELRDSDRFCRYCGTVVESLESGSVQSGPTADSDGTEKTGSEKTIKPQMKNQDKGEQRKLIIPILIVVATLCALIICFVNANSRKTISEQSSTMQEETESEVNKTDLAGVQPNASETTETTETPVKIIPSIKPDQFYYYNGHTYGLYNAKDYELYSYYSCADFCRQQGGHLAVINDISENAFLYDIISGDYEITAFFGYSDEEEEGTFKWSDDGSNYENWTRFDDWDLPDNGEEWGGDEDYAEFNYDADKDWIPNDGSWNDAPFMENTSLFICEWEYEVS